MQAESFERETLGPTRPQPTGSGDQAGRVGRGAHKCKSGGTGRVGAVEGTESGGPLFWGVTSGRVCNYAVCTCAWSSDRWVQPGVHGCDVPFYLSLPMTPWDSHCSGPFHRGSAPPVVELHVTGSIETLWLMSVAHGGV